MFECKETILRFVIRLTNLSKFCKFLGAIFSLSARNMKVVLVNYLVNSARRVIICNLCLMMGAEE